MVVSTFCSSSFFIIVQVLFTFLLEIATSQLQHEPKHLDVRSYNPSSLRASIMDYGNCFDRNIGIVLDNLTRACQDITGACQVRDMAKILHTDLKFH